MANCEQCGKHYSVWNAPLLAGKCNDCYSAQQKRAQEEEALREVQREAQRREAQQEANVPGKTGHSEYDTRVIYTYTDGLYTHAKFIIAISTIFSGLFGGFLGYITSKATGDDIGMIVGVAIGALIGYVIGAGIAFWYKLLAQLVLCFVKIEENTAAIKEKKSETIAQKREELESNDLE